MHEQEYFYTAIGKLASGNKAMLSGRIMAHDKTANDVAIAAAAETYGMTVHRIRVMPVKCYVASLKIPAKLRKRIERMLEREEKRKADARRAARHAKIVSGQARYLLSKGWALHDETDASRPLDEVGWDAPGMHGANECVLAGVNISMSGAWHYQCHAEGHCRLVKGKYGPTCSRCGSVIDKSILGSDGKPKPAKIWMNWVGVPCPKCGRTHPESAECRPTPI